MENISDSVTYSVMMTSRINTSETQESEATLRPKAAMARAGQQRGSDTASQPRVGAHLSSPCSLLALAGPSVCNVAWRGISGEPFVLRIHALNRTHCCA